MYMAQHSAEPPKTLTSQIFTWLTTDLDRKEVYIGIAIPFIEGLVYFGLFLLIIHTSTFSLLNRILVGLFWVLVFLIPLSDIILGIWSIKTNHKGLIVPLIILLLVLLVLFCLGVFIVITLGSFLISLF